MSRTGAPRETPAIQSPGFLLRRLGGAAIPPLPAAAREEEFPLGGNDIEARAG